MQTTNFYQICHFNFRSLFETLTKLQHFIQKSIAEIELVTVSPKRQLKFLRKIEMYLYIFKTFRYN